ncbi:MAG TPA: prenyltransferase, partial [Aestuariivirga sp.]|nr:prenyltransferase [Aestuariivirga sp.]
LPPVKLSHRGLGEIDVADTHSIAVLLFGYVAQGGGLFDAAPWLLALPLGLSVFPAILLSGVPDHAADRAAGKETLVVKLGIGRSWGLAALFVVLAVLAALVLWLGAGLAALRGLGLFAGVHAYFLIRQIWREAQKPAAARRIDGLMVLALSFILWFGLVPLLNLSWLSSP